MCVGADLQEALHKQPLGESLSRREAKPAASAAANQRTNNPSSAATAEQPWALEAGFVDAALAGLARSSSTRQREVAHHILPASTLGCDKLVIRLPRFGLTIAMVPVSDGFQSNLNTLLIGVWCGICSLQRQ